MLKKAAIAIVLACMVLTAGCSVEKETAEQRLDRGLIPYKNGDYDAAITHFTKAIEIKPDYVYAYNNRGMAYLLKKDFNNAERDFFKAIELNPDHFLPYFNLGVLYQTSGQPAKAISYFGKALELNPKFSDAYNNRGGVYMNLNEYDKATDDFTKAMEFSKPDFLPKIYENRGIAYTQKGEYAKAINDYNKVIELAPSYARPYYLNAYVLERVGKMSDALKMYEEFVKKADPTLTGDIEKAKKRIGELRK